jgi:hypothetical protein
MAWVPCQTGSPRGSTVALPLSFAKLPERAARIFCSEPHTSSVQSAKAGVASISPRIGATSRNHRHPRVIAIVPHSDAPTIKPAQSAAASGVAIGADAAAGL